MGELYTCKDVAERYGVQIITVYLLWLTMLRSSQSWAH